ncbi:aconitate hydratase AcnA [Peribacillus sp. SCS-155]|uniref:aconitate hydratase AcnA n=1 Tax=Peribacillus sedimenti TaxID=3115297 RepID=UPI003905D8B2
MGLPSKYVPKVSSTLEINGKVYQYYNLKNLKNMGFSQISKLPFCIKVLLEAALREYNGVSVTDEHIEKLATWDGKSNQEIPFKPARILLHDTTGLPAIVDLAAMRETVARLGGDPSIVNPTIPVDLVVDHSVMVDYFGSREALEVNERLEFERNDERYRFFHWAQKAFQNVNIVPPSTGIMHQINMEFLSSVVREKEMDGVSLLYPDSLVGTDSHTTMINGMGIVAWGVGGIEAEAAMLDQPLYFVTPKVVGLRLTGALPEGSTATDLALTITNLLRIKGVVGKFVEFFGPGVANMSVADRATISNMAPEYGATMGYFPVDHETLKYLKSIGKSEAQIQLIESYYQAQGMFMYPETTASDYPEIIELDLSTVVPCLAGPKRPQDRVELTMMKQTFQKSLNDSVEQGGYGVTIEKRQREVQVDVPPGEKAAITHGSVVLAAITSCTNTSNPTVLITAGLLAKKAIEKGLQKKPYVKSSLAPGSRVVTDYLSQSGLLDYMEKLGFYIAGYGCTTCIGNSGPLPDEISEAIVNHDLVAASVLSGNRNFEGRIHPLIKANYLASPPLVIAYALAGTVNIDFHNEPLGFNSAYEPVFLKDIWPSSDEVYEYINKWIQPELFRKRYEAVYDANKRWNEIQTHDSELYEWDPQSTYIQEPPFLKKVFSYPNGIGEVRSARVLALLGDSVTTDHASPSGAIKPESPAGSYLLNHGVSRKDFNSYPSRRGNHQVMVRGAFANVRIRNKLVPGHEGGVTTYFPTGEVMSIYDAAMKYQENDTNLIILAGKEYGTGSSRDWAAKGPNLLGVKMILAESFERIHRSNLVGMGILPLQFAEGTNIESLGITGRETFETQGLKDQIQPGQMITMIATRDDGSQFTFDVIVRLDSVVDIEYYSNGGIMQTVVQKLLADSAVK